MTQDSLVRRSIPLNLEVVHWAQNQYPPFSTSPVREIKQQMIGDLSLYQEKPSRTMTFSDVQTPMLVFGSIVGGSVEFLTGPSREVFAVWQDGFFSKCPRHRRIPFIRPVSEATMRM